MLLTLLSDDRFLQSPLSNGAIRQNMNPLKDNYLDVFVPVVQSILSTSTHPYATMEWYLIQQMENFGFISLL
jgi:hypothetical protein